MDSPTPSLREQGIQALRAGDLDPAIDLLARAVMADGQDAEAQAYLGVAYSQKGLHAQAKRALQTAVELQPRNAPHCFNLGAVLERAGDPAGAAAAYRETLQLDPEHAQAKARLQAITAQAAAPQAGAPKPTSPVGSRPTGDTPWLASAQPPAAGPQAGPPGAAQCPKCRQWSKPGLSCEWCSAPLKPAPVGGAAPWLQGSSSAAPGYSSAESQTLSSAPDMGTGEAFGRRFLAALIDGVLLWVVGSLVNRVIIGSAMTGQTGPPSLSMLGPLMVKSMTVGVILTAAYSGGMLAARGQTLGKMALGLRVVGPEGGNPSFGRAVLREVIGKWVSSLICFLGYLWMLWDPEQQTWHDKIASTYVERA